MECNETRKYLEQYLDGELSGDDVLKIEAHLKDCEGCREALAELRAIEKAGRSLDVQDPGKAYWSQMTRDVRGRIRDIDGKTIEASPFIEKLKHILWPERISYRLVGLTATAVFVLLLVRITFFGDGFFEVRRSVPGQEEVVEESAKSLVEDVSEDKLDKLTVLQAIEETAEKEEVAPVPPQMEPVVAKAVESRQAQPPPAVASRDNTYPKAAAQRTRTIKEVKSSADVEEAAIARAYQEEEALSDRVDQAAGSGGTALSVSAEGRIGEDLGVAIEQRETSLKATEDLDVKTMLIEELAGLYFKRAIFTGDQTYIYQALRFYQDHDDIFQENELATSRIDSLRTFLEEAEKR